VEESFLGSIPMLARTTIEPQLVQSAIVLPIPQGGKCNFIFSTGQVGHRRFTTKLVNEEDGSSETYERNLYFVVADTVSCVPFSAELRVCT